MGVPADQSARVIRSSRVGPAHPKLRTPNPEPQTPHNESSPGSGRKEAAEDPGEPAAERESFCEVVLVGRLREALRQLNPTLPEEAREEALRKVLRVAT